jgi:hypothetical protein
MGETIITWLLAENTISQRASRTRYVRERAEGTGRQNAVYAGATTLTNEGQRAGFTCGGEASSSVFPYRDGRWQRAVILSNITPILGSMT